MRNQPHFYRKDGLLYFFLRRTGFSQPDTA